MPLDGIVTHGSALVSIQHITGEALPVSKRVGDEIPAGAVNARRIGSNEYVARSGASSVFVYRMVGFWVMVLILYGW